MLRLSMIAGTAAVLAACSSPAPDEGRAIEARNKAIAANFYEDLWFSQNTDRYAEYVAETYVVHDLGQRKGVKELAANQKDIADLFHGFGKMSGRIDYQIAEGDKVATRWFLNHEPNEQARAMGFFDVEGVAIINVFRFNDEGKIVEIWNHRHDPELPQPPDRPE